MGLKPLGLGRGKVTGQCIDHGAGNSHPCSNPTCLLPPFSRTPGWSPVVEPALQDTCQTFDCNGPSHLPLRNLSQGTVSPHPGPSYTGTFYETPWRQRSGLAHALRHLSPCTPERPSSGMAAVTGLLGPGGDQGHVSR